MTPRSKLPKSVSVDKRKPAPDIARSLKLDHGLGFLVRLLETRATALYERLTDQSEITPRQFGAMLTLYQRGTMTLTELATLIRVDRSTLGEMIKRMSDACRLAEGLGQAVSSILPGFMPPRESRACLSTRISWPAP
jgi:hypothetical protein